MSGSQQFCRCFMLSLTGRSLRIIMILNLHMQCLILYNSLLLLSDQVIKRIGIVLQVRYDEYFNQMSLGFTKKKSIIMTHRA